MKVQGRPKTPEIPEQPILKNKEKYLTEEAFEFIV